MKQPHIVIDYAKDSSESRSDLLRHIRHLQEYFDNNAVIEVVAYGKGLDLVLNKSGLNGEEVSATPAAFLACRNSMHSRNLTEDDLITPTVVPSGLGHVVERQLQGWAYLKS